MSKTKKLSGLALDNKVILFFVFALSSTISFPFLMEYCIVSRFMALSLALFGGLGFLHSKLKDEPSYQLEWLDLAIFSYVFFHFLAIPQSYIYADAVFESQKTGLFLIAYALFRYLMDKKALLWICKLNQILTACFLLSAAYYFAMADWTGSAPFGEKLYQIKGLSCHRNLFSSYLFMLFPLNIYSLSKEKKSRYLILLLISLQLLLILFLQTRAVYLGLIIFSLSAIGFTYSEHSKKRRFIGVLAGGIVILLFIAITGLWATGKLELYAQRLNLIQGMETGSGAERRFVWHKTRLLISDNLLFGVGPGNWKIAFPSYKLAGAYRLQSHDIVFTRPHNDYLWIFAETGLAGILSFLSIFIFASINLLKAWKNDIKENRLLASLLLSGLFAYLTISIFDFPKERIEHQIMLFLWLALSASLASKSHIHKNKTGIKLPKAYLNLFAASFLLFCLFVGTLRMKGDFYTYKAIAAKKSQNWEMLCKYANKARSICWPSDYMGIPLQWYEGIGDYNLNNKEKALYNFDAAYQYNPFNFHVINNTATTRMEAKQYEKAEELFLEALEINPKFERAYFNLAYCYFQDKKYPEAHQTILHVEQDTVLKNQFLHNLAPYLKQ